LIFSYRNEFADQDRNIIPFYQSASFPPYWNLSNDELDTFHQILDFHLFNPDGLAINTNTFKNKQSLQLVV